MKYLIRMLTIIAALAVWSTLGAAVWLAIVAREVLLVSISTLISLISNQPPLRDSKCLDSASGVLTRGYARILTKLFDNDTTTGPATPHSQIHEETLWDTGTSGHRRSSRKLPLPISHSSELSHSSEQSGIGYFTLEFLHAILFYFSLAWLSDHLFKTQILPFPKISEIAQTLTEFNPPLNGFQKMVTVAIILIVIPFTALKVYYSFRYANYGSERAFGRALTAMIVGFLVAAGLISLAFDVI